jgi:hypothetical protein
MSLKKTHGKNGVPELKAVGPFTRPTAPAEPSAVCWVCKPKQTGETNVKPKYRILRSNEFIRVGDQAYDKDTRGWFNILFNDGFEGYRASEQPSYRFRRKVK